MFSIRAQVQILLEEDLPQVLASLILSYVEEKQVCVRVWGKYGHEKGKLHYPAGIASLPSGEIVIADTQNHRIQVFTSEGKFLRTWGKRGGEPGEFRYPRGVSTLPSGEIIVADTDNHRIQVFTSKGKFLRMWGKEGKGLGEFGSPYDICTRFDEVFVVDKNNHRIQVFNLKGEILRIWGAGHGRSGKKPGMFYYPEGIVSLPSGEVVITDTQNHRVQVFTPEGTFLRMWGKGGDGPGEFKWPHGMTVLPSGEIIIADTWHNRMQVFTADGKFLHMWGTVQGRAGAKPGEFNHPDAVSVLSTKHSSSEVVVVDTHNHRIQVFRTVLD